MRDEEAVADAPDPGGEHVVAAAAEVLDDLELAEEPLLDRAVVRGVVLRLELLHRRHRLQRQRHVDERRRRGRADGSNGAGSQTASGAPDSTTPS